jgi:hypothetical protein
MKKLILSSISVMAATAVLNAQQVSPNQTATTQQASKPKAAGTRPFAQPWIQPAQASIAKNNPDRGKRVTNNPSHPKPAVNNAGKGKPVVNNPGNGNAIVTNGGHGKK